MMLRLEIVERILLSSHVFLQGMDSSELSSESGVPIPLWLRVVSRFIMRAESFARNKDGTVNRFLANLIEFKVPAEETPRKGICSRDIVIDSETGVNVRIFHPSGSQTISTPQKMPIVLYFHGGGFVFLSPSAIGYDIFCRKLSRSCHAVVISVDYRKAPEYCFPTANDDCFSVLKWLQTQARHHLPRNVSLSHCFLMGDSAGANIVHHVGCRVASEDLGDVKVIGHMLLCPFFGGEHRTSAEVRLANAPLISQENTDWFWRAYLPEGSNRDHPACNVFGPNAPDISGLRLPPSVVVIGEYDPLKDWQMRYVEAVRKAGKETKLLYYEGGIHDLHLFHTHKLASQVLSHLTHIIKSHN
eukprot:c15799_g2_i1 orf=97-1170(-)